MEFLLLLTFVAAFGIDWTAEETRQAALYTALERAVMLHEAVPVRQDGDPAIPTSPEDESVELDLMHMELGSGYLAKTCVCDDESVVRMRMMMAYVGFLRLVGESDNAIEVRLVDSAGEEGERVSRFLDFAGLDGISHFVCIDFMGEALAAGMPAEELRAYIDELEPPRPAPAPRELKLAVNQ